MCRALATLAILTTGLAAGAPALKGKVEPLYYPTRLGDKLVYEMQTGGAGTEITEVVTQVEKKDEALIVSIERELKGRKVAPSQFSVSEKGVTRVATSGRELPVPMPLLKLPGKPGDTWTWEPDPAGAAPRKTTYTLGKEEEVEVPAGKFKALRVESELDLGGNVIKGTLWYAPGVGLVKSVTSSGGGTGRTQVLKSFTPGK
jgi:hypothetical protein